MEYLMSHGLELNAVNMFRGEVLGLAAAQGYIFNRFPNWLPLVMGSSIFDVAYIHEPLALRGDTRAIQGDQYIPTLEEMFEHYLFLQAFNAIAARLGKQRVCDLSASALRRLSLDCLRCARLLLGQGRHQKAQSYFSLAQAYLPEIVDTHEFGQISRLFPDQLRAS
jgi:hypothetical protein